MFPSTESLAMFRLAKKPTHHRFGRRMNCNEIRTLVIVGRLSRVSETDWWAILVVVQVPCSGAHHANGRQEGIQEVRKPPTPVVSVSALFMMIAAPHA
jgi:hypothetical protein